MTANRGKHAEGKFRDMCKLYEKSAMFTYHRFPDAHSGSLVSAPADFQTLYNETLSLIEVKETENAIRLPYGNFKSEQVNRMRMWELAGARAFVLVYHKTTKYWRAYNVGAFLNRPADSASWFFTGPKQNICEPIVDSLSLEEVFRRIHGM